MIPNSTISSTGTRSANSTIDWPRSCRSRAPIRVAGLISEVPHDAQKGSADRGPEGREREHDAGADQTEREGVLDHRLTVVFGKYVVDSLVCHFLDDFREPDPLAAAWRV